MKWFKHFTDAHDNNDLTKVRMKYGADGYAVYWYCLELIASDLGEGQNITFDLNHDSEVIGFNLQIDRIKVEEIMNFMVDLGLFESSDHVISCLKLSKYLDKKNTRNKFLHKVIDAGLKGRKCHGQIATVTDKSGLSPLERERALALERSRELGQNKNHFDLFWSSYPKKVKRKKAVEIWKRKKLDHLAEKLSLDVENRLQNDRQWKEGYVPDPTTYLNGELWNDEIQKPQLREPEMKSQSQILRAGSQLGLQARPGESMDDYATRVRTSRG